MKNIVKSFILLFTAVLLVACGSSKTDTDEINEQSSNKLEVITTFTLLEDIVKQVGGDFVNVFNLVPTGTDPHEYDPLPEDMAKTEEADIIFYNGLNLEGDESGWLAKLIDATGQNWDHVYMAAEGVEPMFLSLDDGSEKAINPHSFLDPVVGILMTENIRDAFIEIDPNNAEVYEENAESYLETLREIDKEYEEKIGEIPEEDRILVTSERAYQYMADRYGLKEGFIWEVDTEENGTPEQITSLINFINEHNPPVLFVETNVDKRPMETVSSETGVEIYGEIFSDEIGKPGEEGDTYVKFLKFNIEQIHQGLLRK